MAKHDMDKKHHSKQKRNDGWVIAIIAIFALVIIGLIVLSRLPKSESAIAADITPVAIFHTNTTASGLSMGDPSAKVKVEEFADFQCPYCQLYYQQLEPSFITKYVDTGLVYYTVSPMAFLGQESVDAASAAYCANDQGKFWEYRDYLFTNLAGENVGSFAQTKLIAFAKALELDVDTFTTCLTSGQHLQDVTDANNYASSVGINSTPSVTINGTIIDLSNFEQAVEDALAAQ
jgi:protein-disulfide isomerase